MLPQLKDGRKLWFDGISSRSLYLCALCNLIELRKQPAIVSLRNVYPPSFIFGCASRYRRTSSFPTVANDEINCAEVHETHADIQPVKVSDVTRNHRSILNSHAGQSGRQLFIYFSTLRESRKKIMKTTKSPPAWVDGCRNCVVGNIPTGAEFDRLNYLNEIVKISFLVRFVERECIKNLSQIAIGRSWNYLRNRWATK